MPGNQPQPSKQSIAPMAIFRATGKPSYRRSLPDGQLSQLQIVNPSGFCATYWVKSDQAGAEGTPERHLLRRPKRVPAPLPAARNSRFRTPEPCLKKSNSHPPRSVLIHLAIETRYASAGRTLNPCPPGSGSSGVPSGPAWAEMWKTCQSEFASCSGSASLSKIIAWPHHSLTYMFIPTTHCWMERTKFQIW